jgi:hypothetical protein
LKVALGYCYRQMSPTAFIRDTINTALYVDEIQAVLDVPYRHDIHKARNQMVKQFLATDCDALLNVDTDILYKPEDVERMIAWDKPMVAGAYLSEFDLLDTCVRGPNGLPVQIGLPDEPTEVLFTGAGFTLIKREVFEKIPYDTWYDLHAEEDGFKHGEDWSFCVRVRQAGYAIILDPAVRLGHLKYLVLTPKEPMKVIQDDPYQPDSSKPGSEGP